MTRHDIARAAAVGLLIWAAIVVLALVVTAVARSAGPAAIG